MARGNTRRGFLMNKVELDELIFIWEDYYIKINACLSTNYVNNENSGPETIIQNFDEDYFRKIERWICERIITGTNNE